MALKGGRRIVVRDIPFKWVLAHGSMGVGHRRSMESWEAPRFVDIIVQGKGRLRAKIESDVWDDDKHAEEYRYGGKLHLASVTPKDVRLVIEKGLDDGWDPTARGQHELAAPLKLAQYSVAAR